jgi:hypothetical protein
MAWCPFCIENFYIKKGYRYYVAVRKLRKEQPQFYECVKFVSVFVITLCAMLVSWAAGAIIFHIIFVSGAGLEFSAGAKAGLSLATGLVFAVVCVIGFTMVMFIRMCIRGCKEAARHAADPELEKWVDLDSDDDQNNAGQTDIIRVGAPVPLQANHVSQV